jgi:hypothetical protein
MKHFSEYWNNFISAGIDVQQGSQELVKIKFINWIIFSAVCAIVLTAIIDIFLGKPFDLHIAAVIISIFISLIFLYRWTKNTELLSNILLFLCVGILLMIYIGGASTSALDFQSSINSMTAFPPIAFFLLGRKKGLGWTIFLLLAALMLLLLNQLHYVNFSYMSKFALDYFISFIIVAVFIYFYESINEKNHTIIITKNSELEKINIDQNKRNMELEELKKALEVSNESYKDKLSEIEKLNKMMVNRELKMIELKKEIETLKTK